MNTMREFAANTPAAALSFHGDGSWISNKSFFDSEVDTKVQNADGNISGVIDSSPIAGAAGALNGLDDDDDYPSSNPSARIQPSSMKEYQAENERLHKAIFNLKLKIYYLKERLTKLHPSDMGSLVQQNIELQAEVEERNRLLAKARTAIDKLQEELAIAKAARTEPNPADAEKDQQIKHYHSVIEQQRQQIIELKQRAKEQEAQEEEKIAQLQRELEEYRSKKKASSNEAKKMEAEMQKMRSEIARLEEALDTAKREGKLKRTQIEKLSRELQEKERQEHQYQLQIQSLIAENNEARKGDEIHSLMQQVASLHEQLGAIRTELQERDKQLQRKKTKYQDYKRDNEIMKQQLRQLTDEFETASHQYELQSQEHERQLKEARELQQLYQQQQVRLQEQQEEINHLQDQLQKQQEDRHNASQVDIYRQSELPQFWVKWALQWFDGGMEKRYRLFVDEIHMILKAKTLMIERAFKSVHILKQRMRQIISRLQQSEAALRDAHYENKQLNDSLRQWKQTADERKESINQFSQTNLKLEEELGEAQARVQQLQIDLQQEKQKSKAREQEMQKLSKNISDEVTAMIDSQKLQISTLEGSIRLLKAELEEKNKVIENAKKKYGIVKTEASKHRKEAEELRRQLEKTQQDMANTNKELQDRLRALHAEIFLKDERDLERPLMLFEELLTNKLNEFKISVEKYLCYDKDLMEKIHELHQRSSVFFMECHDGPYPQQHQQQQQQQQQQWPNATYPLSSSSTSIINTSSNTILIPPLERRHQQLEADCVKLFQMNSVLSKELLTWSMTRDRDFDQVRRTLHEIKIESLAQIEHVKERYLASAQRAKRAL